MPFDIDSARKAGYSDTEIQQFILAHPSSEDARRAGYSNQDIIDHFGLKGPRPAGAGEYIGSQFVKGALQGGQSLAQATELEMGQQPEATNIPGAMKTFFGNESLIPPSTPARYVGAVAEAAGVNPALAAMAPGATLGGALGGEAGKEFFPSNPFAPLVGGLLGGSVGGIVQSGASRLAALATGDVGTAVLPNIDNHIALPGGMYRNLETGQYVSPRTLGVEPIPPPKPAGPLDFIGPPPSLSHLLTVGGIGELAMEHLASSKLGTGAAIALGAYKGLPVAGRFTAQYPDALMAGTSAGLSDPSKVNPLVSTIGP